MYEGKLRELDSLPPERRRLKGFLALALLLSWMQAFSFCDLLMQSSRTVWTQSFAMCSRKTLLDQGGLARSPYCGPFQL